MRVADCIGSLALMATGADAPLPIVISVWLMAVSALVAAHVIRGMKRWSK